MGNPGKQGDNKAYGGPTLKNRVALMGFNVVARMVRAFTNADVVPGPTTYNEDGFATTHNADFLSDPRFIRAYDAGERTGSWRGWQMRWRAYVACWAAEKGAELRGDFVECGVNRGGLSRVIVDYIDFPKTGKKFFLFDTFQGFEGRDLSDAERRLGWYQGAVGGFNECYEAAVEAFRGFNVEFVRGPVPDTLSQVNIDAVAYLSIDMNCVEPEIAAAEHFWDRMGSAGRRTGKMRCRRSAGLGRCLSTTTTAGRGISNRSTRLTPLRRSGVYPSLPFRPARG